MNISEKSEYVVAKVLAKKESIVREIIDSIDPSASLDDIPVKGRRELCNNRETFFWDEIPIVEFYAPTYNLVRNGENTALKYKFNYKKLTT